MIVLDTDVLSALIKGEQASPVTAWLNAQDGDGIWTTAVTSYELELGTKLLPPGRRRTNLENQIEAVIRIELNGRVLPFDEEASGHAAALSARRTRTGLNIAIPHTLIAGIALSRNAALATRNTRHFSDTGLRLIDPWSTTT